MEEPGHELCFLSSPNHDRRVGCNIQGEIYLSQNWKDWEVWRFIRDESSDLFIIASLVHEDKILCSGPDGRVFTTENKEGTWDKQCEWKIMSYPNAEGLENDTNTTIVSEKKQLWNMGPSMRERGGYLILSAEYGRRLTLDENGNLFTEDLACQLEPVLPHEDEASRKQLLRVGATAAAAAVLGPYAVVSAVGAMGFTAGGIAAGSTASWMMSLSGGSVAAGGLVATLQSIGAAGLGFTGTAVSAGAGAVTGAFMNKKKRIVTDESKKQGS
eukprot:scaffold3966_cov144-Skeletonema_marinoi.AAC.5